MKKIIIALTLIILSVNVHAQDKFFTKTGKIHFDATVAASPESIDGVNKTVTCVLDTKTGNLQFSLLMKSFIFERALMEEHFNENYVESSKFPKAEFKGIITNNAAINYAKDGNYPVKVSGKLTIHGQTQDVVTDGKIAVKAGKINATASFSVLFVDYKISIPGLVADKLAKAAALTVDCTLDPLK
jgi:polyisoprenoid-binding protein YceI